MADLNKCEPCRAQIHDSIRHSYTGWHLTEDNTVVLQFFDDEGEYAAIEYDDLHDLLAMIVSSQEACNVLEEAQEDGYDSVVRKRGLPEREETTNETSDEIWRNFNE